MKMFLLSSIFLGLLFLPLLFIDGILIYFMNGSYENLFYLFLFLVLFYILDFIAGIFTEIFARALLAFQKIKRKHFELVSFLFELVGSYFVIFTLDYLFRTVDLSMSLKIIIVAVHGLIFLLIETFSDEKQDVKQKSSMLISIEMQNEIRVLLKENDIVHCIGILQERYPDIPFQDIVTAVRKVHNEME